MSVTVVISLHAHNYNTLTHSVSHSHTRRHAAKKIKGEEDEEEEEEKKKKRSEPVAENSPGAFTLRTADADLVSLAARAPSASQSDETQMNGATSTMCVRACVRVFVWSPTWGKGTSRRLLEGSQQKPSKNPTTLTRISQKRIKSNKAQFRHKGFPGACNYINMNLKKKNK